MTVGSDLGVRFTSAGHILSSDELPDLKPPCKWKKSTNNIPTDSPDDSPHDPQHPSISTESGETSFVFKPTTPPKKIFVDSSSTTVKQEDYHPDL